MFTQIPNQLSSWNHCFSGERESPTVTDLIFEFNEFDVWNVASSPPEFHKSITNSRISKKSLPPTENRISEVTDEIENNLILLEINEIVDGGGKTVWGDVSAIGTVLEGLTFDIVLDNNGKDLDTLRPVADWAKSSGAGQFLFISSARIYKQTEEPPHVEGIKEKEKKAIAKKDPTITQAKRRKQMIVALPKLFDSLRFYFQSINRSVITKDELMEIVDRREVEEQLRLLQEFAPEWIYEKMASTGDLLICVSGLE